MSNVSRSLDIAKQSFLLYNCDHKTGEIAFNNLPQTFLVKLLQTYFTYKQAFLFFMF
jgi:hypothetical protein